MPSRRSSRFGLGFLGHEDWKPNFHVLGAATMLYGTFVTSAMALVLAIPLGVGIALWLALMAPRAVSVIVGPIVEMLAAIPSVIVGFWGVIVLAPFVHAQLEPFLHGAFGFLPIFGPAQTTGLSLFSCGLVLAFMILPIIASLSRDLFLTVPRELREGAEALGATRWEVIRGVVLPTTAAGVSAAIVLALGRALGEAIAVAAVFGTAATSPVGVRHRQQPRRADRQRVHRHRQQRSNSPWLFYLAAILLVIGLATNLIAQCIAGGSSRAS